MEERDRSRNSSLREVTSWERLKEVYSVFLED